MEDKANSNHLVNEAAKLGAVPEGFDPIESEFFQFKEPGDKLTGRLISKSSTRIRGVSVGKYGIQVISEGKVHEVTFLGSMLLDEKLARVPNGSTVYICFTHEEATGEAGNKMKHFTVASKKSN